MGVLVWLAVVAWAGHCVGTIRRMLLLELAQMCLVRTLLRSPPLLDTNLALTLYLI